MPDMLTGKLWHSMVTVSHKLYVLDGDKHAEGIEVLDLVKKGA